MYDEDDARRRWRVAFIVDEAMEPTLTTFLQRHAVEIRNWGLLAPAATAAGLRSVLGPRSRITPLSPPYDEARAGAEIAAGEVDALILLRDPLASRPAAPRLAPLLWLADLHNVPVATNLASAECLVLALRAERSRLAAR